MLSYAVMFILCVHSAVTYLALSRLDKPIFRYFSIFAILSWIFSASYFMQTMAQTLELKLFWSNIKVTALCFTPMVWLWVTVIMTNRKCLGWALNISLLLIAIVNSVIVWNDDKLHIFRKSAVLYEAAQNLYIMKPTFGIWFMTVYTWSIYLPCMISILMFISSYLRTGKYGRFQYGIMILAVVLGMLGGIPQIVGLTYVDTYAITTAMTSILFFIMIHKYHIFEMVPVSKNDVLDIVESGIIIFDFTGKLVESNKYAQNIFPNLLKDSDLTAIASMFELKLEELEYNKPLFSSVMFPDIEKVFSSKLVIMSDTGKHIDGYLLYISDITEHSKLAKIEKEREIANQKNLIIGDIHDSISGSVSVISMLAINAIDRQDAAESSLKQIKEISEDTGREVRFIMNSYDRSDTTYREMVSDLRHIGSMLTDGVKINFALEDFVEQEMEDAIVDFIISTHITRFFKECVVNAIKHSGAAAIKSAVTIEPYRVIISVKDNGKGFDSNVKKGRGLKNLHRRIAQIKGTVSINSEKGTEIICCIPLKENNG